MQTCQSSIRKSTEDVDEQAKSSTPGENHESNTEVSWRGQQQRIWEKQLEYSGITKVQHAECRGRSIPAREECSSKLSQQEVGSPTRKG
eukprot:scaffold189467_cov19-Tisochrysis_lutea.AAC.1